MIAKGRMPARPIRDHLTVLDDLPFRIVAGRVVPSDTMLADALPLLDQRVPDAGLP